MKHYLLLKKIEVQNANAIAGLTYGFPAITNFLGFAHALSRKLAPKLSVTLGGVAVVSHKNAVHARQPSGWGDYVFALTRNPLTQQGNTAPINEEGRMSLQVSLLIELEGIAAGDSQTAQQLMTELRRLVPAMRLAGGQIVQVQAYDLLTSEQQQTQALRRLMPGFVLIDRRNYLAEHFAALQQTQPEATLMDAWCDFATLSYKATPLDGEEVSEEGESKIKANWEYQPKPNAGYLVPIASGYCAISECYSAGEVANVRDTTVPVAFAETAYTVGEWLSVHRLENIQRGIWHYHHDYPWYLAQGYVLEINTIQQEIPQPDLMDETEEYGFDPDN
ncbi:type I-F CRISPR-associated protein Csy2 [Vibrio sp. ABG19]|uniref:type I-F CRISPR-associated protein Csy2 n=1 Tax=Vibrio sp. ABG19 TaxID=2817385 RepID=UPI00249F8D40|nr:type I-F CRISPR-associated protein Csy2 [Vibrio sp. ABG19]WGY44907.1 type I-F CRISPR-associated protein Csy2 [Vibrio sp. ABG19]